MAERHPAYDGFISIHALREESDPAGRAPAYGPSRFQSTPSARRATVFCIKDNRRAVISIHALREESDSARIPREKSPLLFQSTPSARRATPWPRRSGRCLLHFNPRPPRGERRNRPVAQPDPGAISIHALREESDRRNIHAPPLHDHFNPRPPRGERRCDRHFRYRSTSFQSTPSARRATDDVFPDTTIAQISIHALREESDRGCGRRRACQSRFQSTPSARRATAWRRIPE